MYCHCPERVSSDNKVYCNLMHIKQRRCQVAVTDNASRQRGWTDNEEGESVTGRTDRGDNEAALGAKQGEQRPQTALRTAGAAHYAIIVTLQKLY